MNNELNENNQNNKDYNLLPFDLEKALNGHLLRTRGGLKVLSFHDFKEIDDGHKSIVYIYKDTDASINKGSVKRNGLFSSVESHLDLMLSEEFVNKTYYHCVYKHDMSDNLYTSGLHESRENLLDTYADSAVDIIEVYETVVKVPMKNKGE